MTGLWDITEDSGYTGYFQKGSKALVVARYSNGGAVQRGKPRGQGIAGKLFPTTDPNQQEPLKTANFFTIDDIVGASTRYVNDVDFVNAPNVTLSNDWATAPIVLTAGVVFAHHRQGRHRAAAPRNRGAWQAARAFRRARRDSCG